MFNRRFTLGIGALGVVLLWQAQAAWAIYVTTNSVPTLNSNGFEHNTAGAQPSGGPLVGSYSGVSGATIVINDAAPGPGAGANYLRFIGGAINSNLSTAASGTDVVHAEALVYLVTNAVNAFSFRLQNGTNTEINVRINGSGFVQYELPVVSWTNTTVPYQTNTWQLWEIDANLGAGTASFKVNGVQSPTFTPILGANPTVAWARFSTASGSTFYVDSVVPEPSSICVIGLGLSCLIACRHRGQKMQRWVGTQKPGGHPDM